MSANRKERSPKAVQAPRKRRVPLICTVLLLTPFFAGCEAWLSDRAIPLAPGLIITESVTIEPGTYFLSGDSLGAIQIQGNGITVDFNGAVLDGAVAGQDPDTFAGVGLRISDSQSVTIKNAVIKGFKVAVMVTDVADFHLTKSDLSYNWRQRLKSTIERESQDDWMSYHHNENDEWLRYGAAVYLRRADRAKIDHIKVTGGQNGIMATEVNDALFYNNSITFNSSVGIGLYRSSRNQILHNRLDFNVRGHSPGVYNRGQDSAALLLYEQSNENVIAYNSATHSGDGLFLWAGQSTMDTGEGGCNDNLIYGNDFSFAPTNGIEVTFSRNQIINNRIEGCWHGIWGGYSFDTLVEGNEFINNEEHIAVEHGQRLSIKNNQFSGGLIGLRIWERKSQPADWGYSRNRDVRSQSYEVSSNTFEGVTTPFLIENTVDFNTIGNSFSSPLEGAVDETGSRFADPVFGEDVIVLNQDLSVTAPQRMPNAQSVTISGSHPVGRDYMLIDEWGPYDFRSPVIWPRSRRRAHEQIFEILGPPGKWRIIRTQGLEGIAPSDGELTAQDPADTVQVALKQGGTVDIQIEVQFLGEEIIDRFGREISAGVPFIFTYEHFFLPIDWRVSWFEYDRLTDPREHFPAFRKLIEGEPIFSERPTELAYQWYGAPAPGLPENHFATVAEGSFYAPNGLYNLDVTSDDGVRLWLDGELIHDDWTYHAPQLEVIPVTLGGNHSLRAEHFEIDGYATLMISFRRTRE